MYSEINPDLAYAVEKIYKPNGFLINNLAIEPESKKYSACGFMLNGLNIKFRAAYITPKKVGQFVTFWKRNNAGPILPFDLSDNIDFFVVSVRHDQYLGQFIFPKKILFKKNIISQYNKGGKRAMRIYSPWDITESPQAKKTQAWQLDYFLDISSPAQITQKQLKNAFSCICEKNSLI